MQYFILFVFCSLSYFVERTAVHPLNDRLIKCCLSSCERFLLVLNESHHLNLWSVEMFVIIWSFDKSSIKDFIILNNEVKDEVGNVFLLTMESNGFCEAMICKLPTMQSIYSVRMNGFTTLAFCSSNLETLFLVESDDLIETEVDDVVGKRRRLKVRRLTEALPESRLLRLIKKNLFEEAEEFGRQFDLDLEQVFKAKAGFLLNLLSPWNSNGLNLDTVKTHSDCLLSSLNLISDDDYVIECCIMSALPTIDMMLDVLNLAKLRAKKKSFCETEDVLLKKVIVTMHRLGTFQMTFGGSDYDGVNWEAFRKADMLRVLMGHLKNGRMNVVSSIWNRHLCEFKDDLNSEFLKKLLNLIPDQISSEQLKIWFSKGLLPFIVQTSPQVLSVVASWIEERAKNMEIIERSRWPRNALEFCELLGTTCEAMSELTSKHGFLTPDTYVSQVS